MELGIGSVQFGLNYGVSNTIGRIPEAEVRRVLALAAASGVRVLDTASAYGNSEAVLGRSLFPDHSFRIVTKTMPLRSLSDKDDPSRAIREGFSRSLDLLAQDAVYGLLAHHATDLLGPFGDTVWRELEKAKADRRVKKIGSSAYKGEEIDALLDRFSLDIVQLPINVFDQRLIKGGQLQHLKKRGVEIHARSVFLQGLLLMNPDAAPAHFAPVRPLLRRYHARLDQLGLTPVQGALAFIRNLSDINVVLVGINTAEQLRQNISDFKTAANMNENWQEFAMDEQRYINPSFWKLDQDRKNS